MNRSPLKSLREDCDLTLEKVAAKTGLSKQFIIKAEQAVYQEPPDSLLEFYVRLTYVDTSEVRSAYYVFQRETRKFNYGRLIEPWNFVSSEHPFRNWRVLSGMDSLSGLCRDFCVHPAVMSKFENQSYLLARIPEQLVAALLESGYRATTIAALEEAYSEFKERLRKGVTLVN